jgi:choline-sulfatase
MRANYAGNVSLIDEQIARILRVIESRDEMDNTIIVFTSDHGEMNGDYGLVYKKNFLDSAVHVPLVVKTPQTAQMVPEMRDCSGLVEWFDIGATLVDLAGGGIEYRQFARSFSELLDRPDRPHRQDVLSEVVGEYMLLNDRWKAAVNTDGQVYMLFDRTEDPQERTNLAGVDSVRETEDRLRLRILERIVESHMNEGYL